jgi:hypothetical protein
MLTLVTATGLRTRVTIEPAMRAIVTWNTLEVEDTIELIVHRQDDRSSLALPYAAFDATRRASLDGFDQVAKITTDIVTADRPIVAIDVCSQHPLTRVGVSTPTARDDHSSARGYIPASELDVPPVSQYGDAFPDERGWCTPAAIAMLLGTWGVSRDVARVAAAIRDDAYRGTGNWAFAVAYAGSLGYIGTAAYLRNLAAVEGYIAAGIPIATSISWKTGELPGAPIPRSDGHLVVVRGFDEVGDPIVNDPAQPEIRHVYPRDAFESAWLDHGGVALIVAPSGRLYDVLHAAGA